MKQITLNPEMLVLAREARGWSQTEFAERLGLSQPYLSKIENGLADLSADHLERAAVLLGRPIEFFGLSDRVYGPGLSEFFHRKQQSTSRRLVTQVHANLNIRRMQIARLLKSVELPDDFPRFDLEEFESASDVARALRARWQIPAGPVRNLVRVVEDAGGVVMRCGFGSHKIVAISRQHPGLPPMFFMNSSIPADRERISLAHELGHMVMHREWRETMESEAWEFAGELLTPEAEIKDQLEDLTLRRLAELKRYWRVSMSSLVTRANRLGVITARQERYLRSKLANAGMSKREPPELDFPKENPALIKEVVDLYRDRWGYSASDLAALMVAPLEEVRSVYGVQPDPDELRGQLRAIRA